MKVVKEREISSSKNEEENVKNSQIITATLAWISWLGPATPLSDPGVSSVIILTGHSTPHTPPIHAIVQEHSAKVVRNATHFHDESRRKRFT
jgi:hypothetical protein